MLLSSLSLLLASLLSLTTAHPSPRSPNGQSNTPRLHLAGDSTMVATGNNDGTVGWGLPLHQYFSIPVYNYAIAGRSARSFTREGRFGAMANNVTAGDYVLIEFGHNDGGELGEVDDTKGRADCTPGIESVVQGEGYDSVCVTEWNNETEYVLTYTRYLTNAFLVFQQRGAHVIISSATTNNVYETGNFTYTPNRFVGYARDAAKATGATFVDHGAYMAEAYKHLGAAAVTDFYPHDHTHTSAEGADVVARSFVTALEDTGSKLQQYVDCEAYEGPVGE